VRVYIIQQPPIQEANGEQFYRNLMLRNQLSDSNVRNNSLTLKKYQEQQKYVELAFSAYKNMRGVTFIPISDHICDSEYCLFGKATLPYYGDKNHLTTAMAQILKKRLLQYFSL
jgi:hypothetical protein